MQPPPLPMTTTSSPGWSDAELNTYLERPLMSGRDVFPGTEGMTIRDIEDDILKGGRFRAFHWCLSFIVFSYSPQTRTQYVRSWKSPAGSAWFYSLLTMMLGWWSIPGIVFTPLCFWVNARGGRDLTDEVMTQAVGQVRTQSILQKAVSKPLDASQKLLILFVTALPISLLAWLISSAAASRSQG